MNPCLREAKNKINKDGDKSSAINLRNFARILSGPVALDGSKSFRSFVIPEDCKFIVGCLSKETLQCQVSYHFYRM